MSIKPCYWEKILDGTKRFELRRRVPQLQPGDLVIVYASAPDKALVGAFTVERVVGACPNALWQSHRKHLGIKRHDYFVYFDGVDIAWAIEVRCPTRLPEIPLQALREQRPGFRPPQSFMYWSAAEIIRFAPELVRHDPRFWTVGPDSYQAGGVAPRAETRQLDLPNLSNES